MSRIIGMDRGAEVTSKNHRFPPHKKQEPKREVVELMLQTSTVRKTIKSGVTYENDGRRAVERAILERAKNRREREVIRVNHTEKTERKESLSLSVALFPPVSVQPSSPIGEGEGALRTRGWKKRDGRGDKKGKRSCVESAQHFLLLLQRD